MVTLYWIFIKPCKNSPNSPFVGQSTCTDSFQLAVMNSGSCNLYPFPFFVCTQRARPHIRPTGCLSLKIISAYIWVTLPPLSRNPSGCKIYFKGASRYDIRKIFRFFEPLLPCLHLDLICTIKFTLSPLLRPLFHDSPPPSDADIISRSSLIVNHPVAPLTARSMQCSSTRRAVEAVFTSPSSSRNLGKPGKPISVTSASAARGRRALAWVFHSRRWLGFVL